MAESLTLRVEKAVAGGRMLARHEGAIVLVGGAIPGEVVEAVVDKVQRGTMWASTRRVIEPSDDRIDPGVDLACGSAYAHIRYQRQLALKIDILRDGFARLAHLDLPSTIPIAASPLDGYRIRARLHLRGGQIGFFREGTHTLCDPGPTRQLRSDTIEAVAALANELRGHERMTISDIDVTENVGASQRACHVEVPGDVDPSSLGTLRATAGLDGVSCGAMHQSRALTLWGAPQVTDVIRVAAGSDRDCTITLTRHARAFFQGNRYLLERIASSVVAALPVAPVVDLYAGVGLFSIAAAACGVPQVTAIEGDRIGAEDLKRNAHACAGAVHARHQSVEAYVATRSSGPPPAAIIVDPPRTGMTRDALRGAVSLRPPRFVYVSCDVATLARDARILVDSGYRLTSLEAFDLFPNSAHVESLAIFDRTS